MTYSLSFALRVEFRQAHVVQFAARSTIHWRAQQAVILEQDAAVIEEQIQSAGTARLQAIGNDCYVVLAPFTLRVQLTCVAVRIVKLEIHTDPAVGLFNNPDRILAGRALSVESKDTLRRTGGFLAYRCKRAHGAPANSETRNGASRALPHKKSPLGVTSAPPVNACDSIKHDTPFFPQWQEFSMAMSSQQTKYCFLGSLELE
jgi:hypothetical protein